MQGFRLVELSGVTVVQAQGFLTDTLKHGFSTRIGGASSGPYSSLNLGLSTADDPQAVKENRSRFATALSFTSQALVTGRQVHGARVAVIRTGTDLSIEHPGEADALVTDEKGVLLGVLVADCVPILLWDPIREAVAAVHAGWKGTCLRIPAKAVEVMAKEFGSRPSDIRAAIGPSAGPCCYEVDVPVYQRFTEEWPESVNYFTPTGEERWKLDLWGLNRLALQEMGVLDENVQTSELCTICRPDLFFSHRASGGVTGRLAGAIGFTKAGE